MDRVNSTSDKESKDFAREFQAFKFLGVKAVES